MKFSDVSAVMLTDKVIGTAAIGDTIQIDGRDLQGPTKTWSWSQNNFSWGSIPSSRLTLNSDGFCIFEYRIIANRRVLIRPDVIVYSNTGYPMLGKLSLDPQPYQGAGDWDGQVKWRVWNEIRWDFDRTVDVDMSIYYES